MYIHGGCKSSSNCPNTRSQRDYSVVSADEADWTLGLHAVCCESTGQLAVNLLKPTGHVMHQQFNLLKPTGHVMHQQFNLLKPTGYVMHQHLTF